MPAVLVPVEFERDEAGDVARQDGRLVEEAAGDGRHPHDGRLWLDSADCSRRSALKRVALVVGSDDLVARSDKRTVVRRRRISRRGVHTVTRTHVMVKPCIPRQEEANIDGTACNIL